MANYTLKFLLGLYPKTDQIEKKRSELLKEFNDFNQYANSEELARFIELDKIVNSQEFNAVKKYYKELVFKGSEEEKKEHEYIRLKKWHEVKFFYKFKASKELAHFLKMDGSQEIADFENLKAYVGSAEFKKVEAYMKDKNKWEKTDEFRRYEEYQALNKNPHFKHYFEFVSSKGYGDFEKYHKSSEIAAFEEREKFIQSQEFQKLKVLKGFKQTEEYAKYLEYKQWQKDYKHYNKMVESPYLSAYKKLHGSDELAYFNELKAFVHSAQFKEKKKQVQSLRFENTGEYKKLQEYKRIASSGRIKDYYNTKSSEKLSEYQNLEKSKTIADYEALEAYIQSEEFKTRKLYLLDPRKWEKTEEFKQEHEYLALKKSPKIIWYFKVKDSEKFDELKAWNLVFEDDFASGSIDRSKWLTRYFWGEVLLHESFSLPGEKHFFTDGKNFQLNGSTVKIITRSEKAAGKEWNPLFGFIPKEYDYTSGILNTGSSFRTQFGKIEAKVKLDSSKDVVHAFWLSAETKVPQIDIFKYYNGKLSLGTYWGNPADEQGIKHDTVTLGASKFTSGYFIYTLEWTPEKIVWRINDIEIKTQTLHIPADPMYVVLNSGVFGERPVLSSGMEIDWVKCYIRN